MNSRLALVLLLGIDAAILLYEASALSLTYHGAQLLYASDPSLMSRIISVSLALFGHDDIALRLPMILMNLISAVLLYSISGPYAKRDRERVWVVAVFLFLPGIISASLLVDSAALVTLGLLFYIFLHQRYGRWADLLLPLLFFVDASYLFLFLGLTVYALKERSYRFAGLYALFFLGALWRYGFNTGGIPENQFLDTIGLYAAVFTPVIFVYLVYVLYRRFVASQHDIIWTIAVTALLMSLMLSFRQRVEIETFAPFLMAALPLGMQTFYHSYRVRLRPFRKRYRTLFMLALVFLAVNAGAVFFNKVAYLFLDNPSGYFAYRAHVAKELASALKNEGVSCAAFKDEQAMQLRMRFYGIGYCPDTVVSHAPKKSAKSVTIRYYGRAVAEYYVTKMPKN